MLAENVPGSLRNCIHRGPSGVAVPSTSNLFRRPLHSRGTEDIWLSNYHSSCKGRGRQRRLVCTAQRRPLSSVQRWRIVKGTTKEQVDKVKTFIRVSPPVQALVRLLLVLLHQLHPLFKVLAAVESWANDRLSSYGDFIGDEVKREWEWSRRSQQEWDLWIEVFKFLRMSALTIVWEVVTPVSFFWGALLPAHVSWILYDHPLKSPIFLTLLPMFLVKFPIGYPVRWF